MIMTSTKWETEQEIIQRVGIAAAKVRAAIKHEHLKKLNVCRFSERDGEKVLEWKKK